MARRPGAAAVLWLALLAGCQSSHVVTGAGGTLRQARDVVRLVYGQSGVPGSASLTYFAGDIAPAVARMMARYPALRAALDAEVAGLTSDGYVALRDARSGDAATRELLWRENLDRSILYGASAQEAGHGINDWFGDWMPFERDAFAREWRDQAVAPWWYRDDKGAWRRLDAAAPASAEPRR